MAGNASAVKQSLKLWGFSVHWRMIVLFDPSCEVGLKPVQVMVTTSLSRCSALDAVAVLDGSNAEVRARGLADTGLTPQNPMPIRLKPTMTSAARVLVRICLPSFTRCLYHRRRPTQKANGLISSLVHLVITHEMETRYLALFDLRCPD